MLDSTLKINGFDLQDLGFENAQVGAIKELLLKQVCSGEIPNERAILMECARKSALQASANAAIRDRNF